MWERQMGIIKCLKEIRTATLHYAIKVMECERKIKSIKSLKLKDKAIKRANAELLEEINSNFVRSVVHSFASVFFLLLFC